MAFHPVPTTDLALLQKFDTPKVCNVVELFDIRPRTTGHMDGTTKHIGALLRGDRKDMTTVSNEIAWNVERGCEEYVAAVAMVLDYLKSGRVDPKAFAAARKESGGRIEPLARRLQS